MSDVVIADELRFAMRDRVRFAVPGIVAWSYGFLVVALVAGHSGGFRPTTWGWCAVLTLWIAAVTVLVRDRLDIGVLDLLYVGGLTALTAWVAVSSAWSSSVTSSLGEAERGLAYVGLVAAALALVRRDRVDALLAGVLAAVAVLCLYALGTRVLPDRLGEFDSALFGYRLTVPISYWNGLGIFAVIGVLLALAFALRGRSLVARSLGGALLPVLVATMYFTFSRGAWGGLAVGLAFAVALDPRRLQLLAGGLALGVVSTIGLALARDREGLVTVGSTLDRATADGHALTRSLAVLVLVSAAVAVGIALVERRVTIPRAVRQMFGVAIVGLVLVGVGFVWHQHGSPWELASRGWASFKASPNEGSADVSDRLFQLSNNGRLDLWRVSLESFERDPLLGHGAGTFEQLWAASPRQSLRTTEGHSLYLETLGEMGLVGLVLLLVALAVPLVAIGLRRAVPLAAPTGAAYVALLAHAGIDWDWELTGVTAAALLVGAAWVRSATTRPLRQPGLGARVAVAVGLGVLAVAAIPQLVSELRLEDARRALAADPPHALERAQSARSWAPWSSRAYTMESDAYLALGRQAQARAALLEALDRDPDEWQLWGRLVVVGAAAEKAEARRRADALNTLR